MQEMDKNLRRFTVVSRDMVLAAGGTDDMIATRVRKGWWTRLHAGVYRIGPRSDQWLERLRSAVLAAGDGALVSHRAAWVLWGLDGIDVRLVELTVPYEHAPIPGSVIRHRTRRPMDPTTLQGLPVTSVERTLLDTAPMLPEPVLAKGLDSALRLGLTNPISVRRMINEKGGRGVRGGAKLEKVLADLEHSGSTGSPAELGLLRLMRRHGIPQPTLQWEVFGVSGQRYRVDFGWPDSLKGVEVDGALVHASAAALERDLKRQNDLLQAGIELCRFTGRQVQRDPEGVIAEIRRFLALL